MSRCVIEEFSVDALINCIGEHDTNICVKLPRHRTRNEVLFDNLDGENDGRFCIKPRGILWLAAVASENKMDCGLDHAFYCCPDKDVGGFRSCLCGQGVRDNHFECLLTAMELPVDGGFDRQCGFESQDKVKPTLKDTKILPLTDDDIDKLSSHYKCESYP
ncbi:hypothetical protein BDP81DRAFT_85448 [Colletotrichum phormii]|uniref:Uncharacterized protein n=1 Tax=Colletotrichum phormii TaxID=359342 RepID=A0AAJ0EKG8_9PEZI|nr:uncharacterized protein BDP81DRAFT_85448 [Colletotrichum phormii]KAK1654572.1 hypothetical protein BDP81DRAFT_85448 [Colletotrichum phormii]